MMVIWSVLGFIVALGILVTIHEYGHFWVARKLGVKVLTFSVGFGKPIWQRTAKDGVNYVIAAIPLGGYVKMLDEREGEVAPEEQSSAFNRQSVWARMAIVLAGPLANFLLAIVFYWWMFVLGISGLNTEMGNIAADSIAGKAGMHQGDVIVQVDGEAVYHMQDVVKAIAKRLGEDSQIALTVRNEKESSRTVRLEISDWQVDDSRPDILGSLGISHKIKDLKVTPTIAKVAANSPAAQAGLLPGDNIKAFNNTPTESWSQLVELIEPSIGKRAQLLIERNGELSEISVVIGLHKPEGEEIGYLGVTPIGPDRSAYFVIKKGGLFESFNLALEETAKMISLSVHLFKKLVTGDISPKSLSGPFSIAEGAGMSARAGLVYFISFVAMISVNLGFINLLPIPLLDGGHFLYFAIEAIKGKPLSEKLQELGMQIGMLMVFALMAIAIFNDFMRF